MFTLHSLSLSVLFFSFCVTRKFDFRSVQMLLCRKNMKKKKICQTCQTFMCNSWALEKKMDLCIHCGKYVSMFQCLFKVLFKIYLRQALKWFLVIICKSKSIKSNSNLLAAEMSRFCQSGYVSLGLQFPLYMTGFYLKQWRTMFCNCLQNLY